MDLQLIELDRATKIGPELEPLEHALVHRRLEDAVAALVVALGHVHRDVGVPQELLRIRGVHILLGEADADADAWEHLLPVALDLALERLQDPRGGVGGIRRIPDPVEQHGELVPAESCDRVGRANGGGQAPPDLLENEVAGSMAEAVVDGLEVVEVDEHDGDGGRASLGAPERVLDAVGEERAVREVRHRIVERLVGELLLERLALAHVAAVQDDPANVLVVEQVRVLHLELQRPPVTVP